MASAPGGLAVGGALAGDVVATMSLAARVATHYAGYYGYDTRKEEEKAVLLAVMGVGVAREGAAKQAAMLHVRHVAMMVARRAAWRELSEEAIVKLIQRLFAKLSVKLVKRRLAQALPVAGVAAGASLNYALMRRVGTAASFMYRERFLIDKYAFDIGEPPPDLTGLMEGAAFDEVAPDEEPRKTNPTRNPLLPSRRAASGDRDGAWQRRASHVAEGCAVAAPASTGSVASRSRATDRAVAGDRTPILIGHEEPRPLMITRSADLAPGRASCQGFPSPGYARSARSRRGLKRWSKGSDLIGVLSLPNASAGQKLP